MATWCPGELLRAGLGLLRARAATTGAGGGSNDKTDKIRLMRPDPKVYFHSGAIPALDPCRVDTSTVLRAESGKFKIGEFKL